MSKKRKGYVEKLPSGRYRASYWHAGQRLRIRGTFATQEAAEVEVSRMTEKLKGESKGNLTLSNTFNQWADFWLSLPMSKQKMISTDEESYLTSEKRSTTYEQNERILNSTARPFFGDMMIGAISEAVVNSYVNWMVSTRPDQQWTVSRGFSKALSVMELAVRQNVLVSNPFMALGVTRPVDPAGKKIYFASVKEVQALVNYLDERWHLPVATASYCGLRGGEVWGLKIKDVNLERCELSVNRSFGKNYDRVTKKNYYEYGPLKGGERRQVPIPRSLIKQLSGIILGRSPSDPLFVVAGGPRKGEPVRHQSIMKPFKRATEEAGLSDRFTFHDLRHFYAHLCAKIGLDIQTTARYMGHKDINVTYKLYGGLFADDIKESLDKFDSVLIPQEAKIVNIKDVESP